MRIILYAASLTLSLTIIAANGATWWPQFRGPAAAGIAPESDMPVHFGAASNVLWKIQLPAGHSSPCIWENRIFLTGCQMGKLETLCLDRLSGQILWRRPVPADNLEKVSHLSSPAASTPATDGHAVYTYFGSYGLLAYDFTGHELWQKALPTPITQHGAATSPILADDLLLLNRDQDVDSHLLAVNRQTGQVVWRTERPGFRRGFCTPVIWRVENHAWIILPGTLRVAAYNLNDGTQQWEIGGLPNEMCPSPVTGDGLLFVAGWTSGSSVQKFSSFQTLLDQADKDHDGRISREEAPAGPARQQFQYIDANKDGYITREEWDTIANIFAKSENALLAIRPSHAGASAPPEVAWKQTRGLPYVPSTLFYQDRLYLVKNGGLASCFNATNGEPAYREERLGAIGDYFASPIAAGGKICAASQPGTIVIFAAGDTLDVLARNNLQEPIMATPAIVENTLYVRTRDHLYAFKDGHMP